MRKIFKFKNQSIAFVYAMLCAVFCQGQEHQYKHKIGFIYSPGIQWTENKKQDSILDIIIEKDTMVAVRNLLTYCSQEKEEGDYARILLLMINLNYLQKVNKNKDFDFYLKEYRKSVAKNKKYRVKYFPEYSVRK
jgi:hypothetical protein